MRAGKKTKYVNIYQRNSNLFITGYPFLLITILVILNFLQFSQDTMISLGPGAFCRLLFFPYFSCPSISSAHPSGISLEVSFPRKVRLVNSFGRGSANLFHFYQYFSLHFFILIASYIFVPEKK